MENLQPTARYLPSAALVSGVRCVQVAGLVLHIGRSTTYLAVLSPAWNLMAAFTFPLHDLAVRNRVVWRCHGRQAVCNGKPRPISTSATMAESSFSICRRTIKHLGQFDHGGGGRACRRR